MDNAPPIFDKDLFGAPAVPKLTGVLAQRFGMPPFTVLNAREGFWQSRKEAWIRLGIRSELGRGANVLGHSLHSGNIDFYKLKRDLEAELRRSLSTSEAAEILLERGLIGEEFLKEAKKKGRGLLNFSDTANKFQKGDQMCSPAEAARIAREIDRGMDSGAGRDGNLLGLSSESEDYRRNQGAYRKLTAEEKAELTRREKAATPGGGGGPNSKYFKKKPATGRAYNIGMGASKENDWAVEDDLGSGTSIFDPVLCELLYDWFSPAAGQVLDPFAGGSVRGIVAACLGRKYWGCDLSGDQIAANIDQVGLLPPGAPVPQWLVGDSAVLLDAAPAADFILACPPYYDLEVYSEDPRDLSQMSWDDFRSVYDEIIAKAVGRLHDNRFAAFVVGDVRDEDGNYRNLPGYTTACFRRAGMQLYNEMMLVTAVGSLSIRTERQFFMSRKLGKTHQNVLVYVKGDAEAATDAATGMTAQERRDELKRRAEARKNAMKGWD